MNTKPRGLDPIHDYRLSNNLPGTSQLLLTFQEKKNPAWAGFFLSVDSMRCHLESNIGRLEALRPFFYLIADRLTFGQRFKT
jgi:hypothetical protein